MPVIKQIVSKLGKKPLLITDNDVDREEGICRSDWVLVTTERDLTIHPKIRDAAKELEGKLGMRLWTDDFSNLIQTIKHRKTCSMIN